MVIPEYENPKEDAGGIEGPVLTEKEADKDWKTSNTLRTIRPRSDGSGART